jgi:hypothetical protein
MKRALLAITALFLGIQVPVAFANEAPKVESFTVTPTEVELTGKSTRIDFELVVSHPFGIENNKTEVTISSSRNDNLLVTLSRIDSPINPKLSKVTFRGGIDLPRNLNPGAYTFLVSSLKNNATAGYQYSTGTISGPKIRNLVGAEYGILVRNFGDLNLDYVPFNGPAYDTSLGIAYEDSIKYNANNAPIWKVGEVFNPLDYFELRVPTLNLSISTSTPAVCVSDGKLMRLIAEGSCAYTVFTTKTSDYKAKSVSQNATITAARVKIQLTIEKLSNQTSLNLPKTIEVSPVYSAATGYVFPQSESPTVCLASGYFVKLLSGGICTLSYKSMETTLYRASDVYFQTFEITRDSQTIDFALPAQVKLGVGTIRLAATASSGGSIKYTISTPEICSLEEEILKLLSTGNCNVTAAQEGTSLFAPISQSQTVLITKANVQKRKAISCIKGSKKITLKKSQSKCPKGFKNVR